jgi:tRNA wybutosine-synthesizing protein 3
MEIVDYNLWLRCRSEALARLARDYSRGRVDRQLIPLLEAINSTGHFYTASSCYGRVVLIEIENIGDKAASGFYKSWHGPVSIDEIASEVERYRGDKMLWLLVQSTIIHVSTYDLGLAVRFRNLALEAGYKYSKILSISRRGIVVEVLGTERLDIPLIHRGERIVPIDKLKIVEKYIGEMFFRIEKRKNRFIELIKREKFK